MELERNCNGPPGDLLLPITPTIPTVQAHYANLDPDLPARRSGAFQQWSGDRKGPVNQEPRPASGYGARTLAGWLIIVALLGGAGSNTLARTMTIRIKP